MGADIPAAPSIFSPRLLTANPRALMRSSSFRRSPVAAGAIPVGERRLVLTRLLATLESRNARIERPDDPHRIETGLKSSIRYLSGWGDSTYAAKMTVRSSGRNIPSAQPSFVRFTIRCKEEVASWTRFALLDILAPRRYISNPSSYVRVAPRRCIIPRETRRWTRRCTVLGER